ncbi:MAG: CARDB domain-containing protein [Thermoplasmata archaeon]
MKNELFSGLMMKSVSFLVVGTMIFGSMIGILDVRQAEAVIIDIDGDVIINEDTRWQDAIYRVDGHVTISAGATLEIVNGGLVFLQDITHVHNLTIQAPNGELHLTNSMVSTWLDQINSYPKLNVHVYGRLVMDTNSMLKFPGTLNAYSGSFVELKNSVITGFSTQELGTYVGTNTDEYDDAPIMTFQDSTVDVYDSRIEKLFERTLAGPDPRFNITLLGNTEMTIVNSYVGVDFSNYNDKHNVILADDTSTVYIYNMTIDESQNPPSDSQRSPCLQPYGNVIFGSDTALPDAIHPTLDTTTTPGQDETFLQFDDNIRYTVMPGETMYIDAFDLDLPYLMTSAILWVTYSTDPGYDGTRPVQWGLEGEPGLRDTTITPVDTTDPNTEFTSSFDIYGAGMDTFNELRYLDIAFYNDASLATNVYFERVWIDVGYYVIDSEAVFYIYRWLVPTVRDEDGAPVEGAIVNVTLLGDGSLPQYPDNGWANDPNAKILNYLGRTVADYKTTGPDGKAWIPLLAEWMNSTLQEPTFPNTEFIGNYNATASYGAYSNFGTMSFNPFPAMSESDNTFVLNIYLTGLVLDRPDLTPTSIWTDPPIIHAGDNVTIWVTIENVGSWGALEIWVYFFVGEEKLQSFYIGFLGEGDSKNCSSVWYNASVGNHIVIVEVDPPIETGGNITESNEGNNRLSEPISVEPLLPDLVVFISAPGQGYPGNPLTITATIRNQGNASVTEMFFVEFFVKEESKERITYSDILDVGGTDTVDYEWTPSDVDTYTIRVVVDPTDTVDEISEDNNEATWIIEVVPVPNLVVISDYVSPDDPCPSEGQDIRANAWISNLGQVDADIFEVSFLIDGVPVGNWTSSAPLVPGATVLATSPFSQPTGSPGFGKITVIVDPTDSIKESSNDDNTVTAQYIVYTGTQTIWSMNRTLDSVNVAVHDNLVITGNIVIMNGNLTVTQSQSGTGIGRHYMKIQDGGTLTLINGVLKSNIDSNWPLNVCILGNGSLITKDNSQILLDSPGHGRGVLYSRGNGTIDLEDTLLDGDIRATGFDVSFKNVDLTGEVVFIYTQNTSYIWDTIFWTVNILSLYTDDDDVGTVDFDIRNVSFADPVLDQQLVFGGEQWIWLTDVETYIPTGEDWWTNMIVGNAKVSVFYWLTIELVDGTGALLPMSNLTLYHLITDNLTWEIARDDMDNPIENKTLEDGVYVYRALSQERFRVDIDHYENWTYLANGSKLLSFPPPEGDKTYYPDRDVSVDVMSNSVIQLVFSALTPEFWIESMYFEGGNGISYDQPHNRPLNITADIHNDGKITSANVEVYFYATELDPDRNGIMENEPSTYEAYFIGAATIVVPANGTGSAVVTWTPGNPAMVAAGNKVSVFVDMYNKIKEVNELNNIDLEVVTMFRWPDLEVPIEDIITIPTQVPVHSPVTLQATIRNIGAREGTNVRVEFFDDDTSIGNDTIPLIQSGESVLATVTWVADRSGPHEVKVIAYTENLTIENKDYNWENNEAAITKSVLSVSDLMIDSTSIMNLGTPPNVTQARDFTFTVRVYNLGESSVSSFSIAAHMESTANTTIASLSNLSIGGDMYTDFELSVVGGLPDTGTYDLIVVVDSEDEVTEADEANNEASISLEVVPPKGFVTISMPVENKEFSPGVTILVQGYVQTNQMDPIPGIMVHAQLFEDETPVTGTLRYQLTDSTGEFTFSNFEIPENVEGTFTIVVSTNITTIMEDDVTIKVVKPVNWWEIMFLGLPLWLWLIIIAVIVAIVVGVTLYLYFVGLGKLVECGNCGAFIPEASEKCPKCGVEFEKDLAKCSTCGAWIPIGVKLCPECGVEFATGELEMEEYREKMRMQYEEVVAKFRAEADKALGRTLTEEEFQEWWKTQPTFMTFEDWLREEEEMRKMGSRPCPSCGTLNSVTAKVCHKCGTLFEEVEEAPPREKPPEEKPPEKPEVEAAPPREARPPVEKKVVPEEKLEKIEKPVPKKVVKKPVERPVVQKKVIKKPVVEEEEEEEKKEEA